MPNYTGTQINETVTIVERAGEAITDVRNKLLTYDANGDVVLATNGSKPFAGIALIENGEYGVNGAEAGKVAIGDSIDIQIKDITKAIAGGNIKKGEEVTATTGGKVVKASTGDYVFGVALSVGEADKYIRVQIRNYQKNA